MDYIHAFWVGGLICALVQILLDRTKLMSGRIMVLLVWHRGGSGGLPIVSALAGFRRSGGKRTTVRVWKSSLERSQRGGRSGRIYRHLFGRLQGKRSRNQRGIWFSVYLASLVFSTENRKSKIFVKNIKQKVKNLLFSGKLDVIVTMVSFEI